MRLRKFEDHLHEMLRDPEFAAAYVDAALEDGGVDEFLDALRQVSVVQGSVRGNLYKSLAGQTNPRVKTLDDVLHAFGMRLTVARNEAALQARWGPSPDPPTS